LIRRSEQRENAQKKELLNDLDMAMIGILEAVLLGPDTINQPLKPLNSGKAGEPL
jgi:hypothetical protein